MSLCIMLAPPHFANPDGKSKLISLMPKPDARAEISVKVKRQNGSGADGPNSLKVKPKTTRLAAQK